MKIQIIVNNNMIIINVMTINFCLIFYTEHSKKSNGTKKGRKIIRFKNFFRMNRRQNEACVMQIWGLFDLLPESIKKPLLGCGICSFVGERVMKKYRFYEFFWYVNTGNNLKKIIKIQALQIIYLFSVNLTLFNYIIIFEIYFGFYFIFV